MTYSVSSDEGGAEAGQRLRIGVGDEGSQVAPRAWRICLVLRVRDWASGVWRGAYIVRSLMVAVCGTGGGGYDTLWFTLRDD